MSTRIGFVGFGEVASSFTPPMKKQGATIAVYDILLSQPGGREILQGRVKTEGITFAPLEEVIKHSEYILSTVTTQVARKVAAECAQHLRAGQVFLDLNSCSPSVKAEIARIIEPSGAGFVEGAILGAVGATGAQTQVLLGGTRGREAAETLSQLGLKVAFYSPEVGKASTFKMLRSIFSKGLEALILELLVAGKRAGMEMDLWRDIVDLMTKNPFDRVASNWVQTHAVAYERRYHEMRQVVETMREIGVEPVMTAGTEAFFARALSMGLNEAFPVKPESVEAVVDYMEQRLRHIEG
ncbi:MAG: DUF1932 domain-containing protein [Bacteroidota bacterium]